MHADLKKVKEIKNTPQPENSKALQSFLGLTNYMKRFIYDYSTITAPLRELLKENVDYIWTDKQNIAFENLKTYFDDNKHTLIYTDASPHVISCILLQKTPNKEDTKIISYNSRALTEAEKNYSQLERECLALSMPVNVTAFI